VDRAVVEEGGAAVHTSPPLLRETVNRSVEWIDTDAAGHHHNSFILRSVEAAEARLLRRLGLLQDFLSTTPRVRHEVDYRSKLYFGQETTTILEVESLGRSSMTFRFDIWGEAFEDAPGGPMPRRLAATGKFVTVHVPHGAEASAPWPPRIRQILGGHVAQAPRPGRSASLSSGAGELEERLQLNGN
jgi:acyl-CoA thioester hydrolase